MSLRIWLPFHGNSNQIAPGSNVTITGTNVNFNAGDSTFGSCTYFNGNSYVLSSGSPLNDTTKNWTFSCWFWASSSHNGCIFSNRTAVNEKGFTIFWYSNNKILFDDGVRWEFSHSIPLSQWVHLTFICQRGVRKAMYVNGVLAASTTTTGTPTGAIGKRFTIGASQDTATTVSGNYLTAWLYDVRIYNHALTDSEIAALARKNNYGSDKQDLAIWAPMNKNTINYGLRNINLTNNGLTTDTGGKIGSCYVTNGSSSYLEGTYKATQNISFCIWVYFNSIVSGHLFDARTSDGNTGYQPMYIEANRIQIGNSGTSFPDVSYTWQAGQWYHICVTHDYNQAKVYINGSLVSTQTGAGGRNLGVCNFNIGCRCSHTSFTNIKFNDVRIYNRTLTATEVKNISRGLCLHYRLDNNMWSGNLLSNADNGSGWSYSSFDNEWNEYTRSTTSTSESYIQAPATTSVVKGKTYTLSCWAKSNGYVSSMEFFKYNSSVSNIQSKSFAGSELSTDYKLFSWTFVANATENVIIRFDNNGTTSSGTAAVLTIREPTLEEGPISSLKSQGTASSTSFTYSPPWYCYIEDSSGMGNHGNSYGGWSWTGITPKYKSAAFFNGKSSAIQIPSLPTLIAADGIFTFNVWIFKGDWGSDSWETIFGGPSGFELEGKLSTSQNNYIHPYSWGGGSTSTPNSYSFQYSFNQWHMVTMVRTTSNTKFYLDGQLKVTGTAGSIPSGNYFIGSWRDFVSQNFRGWMSDARIYSTALSDADVSALYRGEI